MTTEFTIQPRPFRLEGVPKEFRQIPLSSIDQRPEDYCFRGRNQLTEKGLDLLIKCVKIKRDIDTPLLVQARLNDRFLLLDGHRRFAVLGALIRQGVEGFRANMLVPAVVIPSECSELQKLVVLASSNIQQKSLTYYVQRRLAYCLFREGMPIDQISGLLRLSDSVVGREIVLGCDPRIMEHVRLNHIGETDAEKLFKLARDKGRFDEFLQEFESWANVIQEELEENAEFDAKNEGGPVKLITKWPPGIPSRARVEAWMESLNDGIGFFEPAWQKKPEAKPPSGTDATA
jgi:hypothetical protein